MLADYSFMITQDTKVVFGNSCGLSRMRTDNSMDPSIEVLYIESYVLIHLCMDLFS
jgi:hypothetical protein